MKKILLFILILVALRTTNLSQSDNFVCNSPSGFGEVIDSDEVMLDLQCSPAFDFTFEIEPNEVIKVSVNLSNYYLASGESDADFYIHLAMQRANIEIRESGSFGTENIVDANGAIQDVRISADGDIFTFEIENKGFRSAIFDLSVRPR